MQSAVFRRQREIASLDIERLGNAFTPDDRVSRIYINFCNPWSKNA